MVRVRYILPDPEARREALRPLFDELVDIQRRIHPGRPAYAYANRAADALNSLAFELTGEPFRRAAGDGAGLTRGPR